MADVRALEATLGAAVRAKRVAAGLTRVELAERANVSVGAVRNLEVGAGANVSTLVRAVHALGADGWLDALTPAPVFSPLAVADAAKRASQVRQRVRRPKVV